MTPTRAFAAALAAATLLLAQSALATPRPGEQFPVFAGRDVVGQPHSSREFAGHRTLVVVITDRGAADAMRAWNTTAATRLPPGTRLKALVSLHLPPIATDGMVRVRARMDTPREYWGDTLIDGNGQMAHALGLPRSDVPYAFALDPHGRVLAAAHARVDAPEAHVIWQALHR
jgi:hypothetical protein